MRFIPARAGQAASAAFMPVHQVVMCDSHDQIQCDVAEMFRSVQTRVNKAQKNRVFPRGECQIE